MPSMGRRERRRAAWRASAWLMAGAGLFLSIGGGVAIAGFAVGGVDPVYTMPKTVVDSWTPAAPALPAEPVAYDQPERPGLAYVESPPAFPIDPAPGELTR